MGALVRHVREDLADILADCRFMNVVHAQFLLISLLIKVVLVGLVGEDNHPWPRLLQLSHPLLRGQKVERSLGQGVRGGCVQVVLATCDDVTSERVLLCVWASCGRDLPHEGIIHACQGLRILGN